MKVDKVSGTYNTYKVELSYSQLLAFRDGLKARHESPESDEALKEIDWYLARVPRPGEEKDSEGNHTDPTQVAPESELDDVDLDRELPEPEGAIDIDINTDEVELDEPLPEEGDAVEIEDEGAAEEEELEAPPV